MLEHGMLIGLVLCLIGIGIGTIMLIYNNSKLIALNTNITLETQNNIKETNSHIMTSYIIIGICLGIIFIGLLFKTSSIKQHAQGTNYETYACFVLFFIIYLCTIGAIISLISTFSGQALVGCELSPVDYRDNSKNSKVLNIRTHQITNININYIDAPNNPPTISSMIDKSGQNISEIEKYIKTYVSSVEITYYATSNKTPNQDGVILRKCVFKKEENLNQIVQLFIFLYQIPISINDIRIQNNSSIVDLSPS